MSVLSMSFVVYVSVSGSPCAAFGVCVVCGVYSDCDGRKGGHVASVRV